MVGKKIFLIFVAVFLIGGALAAFDYDDVESIVKSYSAGEKIRGMFNISFDDESADSILTSNFEGNISLLDFLEENGLDEGDDFDCNNAGCLNGYTPQSPASQFNLDSGDKTLGIVISGGDVSVNSVRFKVQSNEPNSCSRPIAIDILDDEELLVTSTNYVNQECGSKSYGCFNSGSSNTLAEILSSGEYCEKISLNSAPAFKVGARVKNSTQGYSPLIMNLYDNEGDKLGGCTLPQHTQETQDLSCVVEHSEPNSGEYFVCIGAEGEPSNYLISTETVNSCGNTNPGSDIFTRDYEIFANEMSYGIVNFFVNDSSIPGEDLGNYIDDYVQDIYGGSCSPNCVVPVKFSGRGSSVTVSNVEINYDDGGTSLLSNNFFNLDTQEAEISSGELALDIVKAGFVIPHGSDEEEFELFIGGDKVFDTEINISASFDFSLKPLIVGFGQNALFEVVANRNITGSEWDFGDGEEGESSGKTINHRYLDQGEFDLRVRLTDSRGVSSSKTFTITVGEPSIIANSTYHTYRNRIKDLENDLGSYPIWVSNQLKSFVDTVAIDEVLDDVETDLNNATSDEDYQNIILKLVDLDVPSAIRISQKGDLSLLAGFENIDVSYIEEISGDSVSDSSKLESNIGGWMSENLDSRISFEQINVDYDSGSEVLLTKFKIETDPKGSISDAYLIIDYGKEGMIFSKDYGAENVIGGTFIELTGGNEIFEFIILDKVTPTDLNSYISPVVSEVGNFDIDFATCDLDGVCESGEDWKNCRSDCKPVGLTILWLIILFVVFLVVYVILQEWYKRNYEKSLFKNENDLYNLVNFVYNARKSGHKDGEIKGKLRKAKWSGERITYVIRKIDGKRTGMWEIPLFKFRENKKVKKELQKRQRGKLDSRFSRAVRR